MNDFSSTIVSSKPVYTVKYSGNRNKLPELLRCKRRNISSIAYSLPSAQPVAVARRNERERNRVKMVNMGFHTLRQHIPDAPKNKKMSKVETLRSAVEYIRRLQQILTADQTYIKRETMDTSCDENMAPSATSPSSCSFDSTMYTHFSPVSPTSTKSSGDSGHYEDIVVEKSCTTQEQDLFDFTTLLS